MFYQSLSNFFNKDRLKFYSAFLLIFALVFPYHQFDAYPDQFRWYYHILLSHFAVAFFLVWGGRYTMIFGTVIAFQRVLELIAVAVWGMFFKGITAHIFKLFIESDNDEIWGYFIELYPQIIMGTFAIVVYVGLYVYACIYAVKYLETKRKNKAWWKNGIRFSLAILILSFGWTQKVRLDIFFWENNRSEKIALYSSKNTYPYLSVKTNPTTDVYFIVGESVSHSNMSLYGYERKTTPYLDSLKNSKNFSYYRDAIAAAGHTEAALQSMFSRAEGLDDKIFFLSPNLVEELNNTGYRTVWITHRKMQKQLVYPSITNSATDFYNSKIAFDDRKMLPYLKKAFKNVPSFYFIHMSGSHMKYADSYEASQRKWSKSLTGDKKKDNINAYDDTILALDKFIKNVHVIAKQNSKKTNRPYTIIYLSDHGQNLYKDGSDWVGHSGSFEKQPNGLMVPFIIINKNNLPCANTLPNENKKHYKLNNLFFDVLKSVCAVK